MTREERTKLIKHLKYNRSIGADYLITDNDVDEIIKALEQESSGDFISRQAVFDMLENAQIITDGEFCGYCTEDIDINILPSVIPQPEPGHWIYTPKRRLVDETDEGGVYTTDYRCTCSECGGDFGFQKMSDAYCKYCGAKMQEEENNGQN